MRCDVGVDKVVVVVVVADVCVCILGGGVSSFLFDFSRRGSLLALIVFPVEFPGGWYFMLVECPVHCIVALW